MAARMSEFAADHSVAKHVTVDEGVGKRRTHTAGDIAPMETGNVRAVVLRNSPISRLAPDV